MRILVCGGRNFTNQNFVWDKLHQIAEKHVSFNLDALGPIYNYHELTIISGMAKGVDTIAADWAVTNWCKLLKFPADWDKYGKAAGAIRNQQMLDEGKPDLVVAFPGGRGTADMVRRAKKADIKVLEIKYEE